MFAIHDQFTRQLRKRLKTSVLGLGLVRLLQDAGLSEEAGTTLSALQYGFQGVADESDKLKDVSTIFSVAALRARRRFVNRRNGPDIRRAKSA
jgi:hypothetical protein